MSYPTPSFEQILMAAGRKYKIISDANDPNIANVLMVEQFKQAILAAHTAAIEAARREELLEMQRVINRTGVAGAAKWHIDDRLAQLQPKEGER